jgi:hypothetical protein
MAEALYDEGFHVTYPAWLLVKKTCVTEAPGGTVQLKRPLVWSTMVDEEGHKTLPVFTDDSAALDYCVKSTLVDEVTMIAAQNAQYLADFLELIKGTGCASDVSFDPQKSVGQMRCWPIDYAVDRLRKGLDL